MTGFVSKRQAAQGKLNDDTQVYAGRKRGSIALARSLCYQINGAADDSDDMDGGGYGSVDIAEILSAEVLRLQKALAQPVQEQQQARVDVITVNLMREGINKHRARELADHFVNFTLPPPLPVQEPVAWVCYGAPGKRDIDFEEADINGLPIGTSLYITPPQQQAEPPPEWPLIKNILAVFGLDAISFVAKWQAAQRTWVGLTKWEREAIAHACGAMGSEWLVFIEAVEKALKEKNR